MRLIDADDLVVRINYKHYKMTHEYEHNYEYSNGYYDGACEVIDAPTVEDAVVVVRCKNCEHGKPIDTTQSPFRYYKPECIICYCEEVIGDEPMVYPPTHFCGYGKRKSDNE